MSLCLKRDSLSLVSVARHAHLVYSRDRVHNRKPPPTRFIELIIKDTVYAGFVTKDEVAGILQKKGPPGKKMEVSRLRP